VNDYEILLMLDPELEDARSEEIIARIRERVETDGGSWDSHDAWGRRRLAYEIAHKSEGTYHLLFITAEPETLAEVTRVLKITDGVMRHLAVRRVKNSQRTAPPQPPAPTPSPAAAAAAAAAPAPAAPAASASAPAAEAPAAQTPSAEAPAAGAQSGADDDAVEAAE
jgi:small subunit ribosomal protein S6